jgi:hypothetical protein
MKVRGDAKELRDFFLRAKPLGAPFINLLKTDGVTLEDPEFATPVIIASDMFIAQMQTRNRLPVQYSGFPSFLQITGLNKEKSLAHCFGRINRVLIYRIPLNSTASCLGNVSALLCNLSLECQKHCEARLKIIRSRGPMRAYLNHLANYITCEEHYVN